MGDVGTTFWIYIHIDIPISITFTHVAFMHAVVVAFNDVILLYRIDTCMYYVFVASK